MKNTENQKLVPVGITPKHIWVQLRIQEIREAIERYHEEKLPIPVEWSAELQELNTYMQHYHANKK